MEAKLERSEVIKVFNDIIEELHDQIDEHLNDANASAIIPLSAQRQMLKRLVFIFTEEK